MTAPNYLVCFALKEEARPFRRMAGSRPGVRTLVTGMGARNAERALARILQPGNLRYASGDSRGHEPSSPGPIAAGERPGLVLTCGLAGGLNPDLDSGTVLFALDETVALGPVLVAAGARGGRFHFSDRIAATAAEKELLRRATGADAVEMESQPIRNLCRAQGIPSATIRVILDASGEDLPLDFNLLLTSSQRLDAAKLALALLKSPGKTRAMLRLWKRTRTAAAKLASVLAAVTG